MTHSELADLVQHTVSTSLRTTIIRTMELTAEELAADILRDPAVRNRLRLLALQAFERAWHDLQEEPDDQ
jgi:hypothetical protein